MTKITVFKTDISAMISQFVQIAVSLDGVYDGDLISKRARSLLIDVDLVDHTGAGYNILTEKGIACFEQNVMISMKKLEGVLNAPRKTIQDNV